MSALRDYVAELGHQADLLDRAACYDDVACSPTEPDQQQWTRHDGKRHWTRQDGNRCNWECDLEAAIDAADEAAADTLYANPPRMRTRLEYLLNRHRRSIDPWHAKALADSQERGIFGTVAPLLVECLAAHRQLLSAYSDDEDAPNFEESKRRHRDAVEQISMHIPGEQEAQQAQCEKIFPQGTRGIKSDTVAVTIAIHDDHLGRKRGDIAREYFEDFPDRKTRATKTLADIRARVSAGRIVLPDSATKRNGAPQ